MGIEYLVDDIHDVNLSYLLLMQRLISADRDLAMYRLKLDEAMVDFLESVPVQDLVRLARCDQLLCQFSLDSAAQLSSLISAPKDDDMRRVHAAILLSSQDRRKGDRRQADRRKGERRKGNRSATERRATRQPTAATQQPHDLQPVN